MISITVENNILEKAKKSGVNISAAAEKGIRERSGVVEIEMDEPVCAFCGKKQDKAWVDHLNNEKYHDGLTWLYPDEKWICVDCLKRRLL